MAKRQEKLGNAPMARRLYEQGLAYWKQHASKVNDRGLALVAQAQYLALEPEFEEYDRLSLNVLQRDLQGRLKEKAKRMLRLEAEYGKIALLKQPEPAICALQKVGIGYQRYAKAIYEIPVPKQIRTNKEYLAEYKTQIAGLVEQLGLEKKATDAFGLAVAASRDSGVVNACAKESLAVLQKAKPEEFGPSPEVVPAFGAVAAAEQPAGYGLVGDVQAQSAPRAPAVAPKKGEAALPVLKTRPAAATGAEARGGAKGEAGPETGATNDPQLRTPDPDQPVPVKRKKKAADDDEDLLP
jgi:hypothetical protein